MQSAVETSHDDAVATDLGVDAHLAVAQIAQIAQIHLVLVHTLSLWGERVRLRYPRDDLTSVAAMTDVEIRDLCREALYRYCRGVDRLDKASIASAFHPGAELLGYGSAQAITIEAFVDHVVTALGQRFVATQHSVSNVSVDVRGDHAVMEAYVHAIHVEEREGERRLHTFHGRYVDRVEPRDGEWRIVGRHLRQDVTMVEVMGPPMSGDYPRSGRGGTPDPIWD